MFTLSSSIKNKVILLIFLVGSIMTLIVSIRIGSTGISMADIGNTILGHTLKPDRLEMVSTLHSTIIWKLRIPRVLLGLLVGGALAISGGAVQSSLRNPLASPYTLGVSSGAALGVSLYMLSGIKQNTLGIMTLPVMGFIAGMTTMVFVLHFAQRVDKRLSNQTLILSGMVISLFVNALLTIIMALYRESLESIIFWQMGSLSLRGWAYVRGILPFFLIGSIGLLLHSRVLDIMSTGDESATAMGIEVAKVKMRVLFFSALLTGSAVAMTGTIGFIGLVAPHIVRKITGPQHSRLLPISLLAGGCFLIIADMIARTVLSPSELPVGAITAFIGAPFFALIFFMRRK